MSNPAKEVSDKLNSALINKRCQQLFEMLGAQDGLLHSGNIDMPIINQHHLSLFSDLAQYL